jgi:hypothetical protein
VKQYRLPQAIKEAYRDRDLVLPRSTRTYADIVRDLDAVAAMHAASDPEAQELLARDRLRLLHYCADVSAEEIERVLQRCGKTVAAMSEFERDRMIQNVARGRPNIAEHYLVPLLFSIRQRIKTLIAQKQDVARALSAARGESLDRGHEREGAWDDDFGLGVSRPEGASETDESSRGTRYAFRLQQLDFPYDVVLAAWDTLLDKASTLGDKVWIIDHKLQVTSDYERPAEDMDREIQRAMQVFRGQPVKEWAHTIAWTCSHYPALLGKYLPPIIAEYEKTMPEHPEPDDQRDLDSLREALAEALAASRAQAGAQP